MPELAKLWATVGADTRDAETGFARVGATIGGFANAATVALAAAGAGIVAAGAAAVNSAAGFEKTMSGVRAVSGATNEQMKSLSGLALQLGKDTSFSASEAAMGIEELVKGGLSIDDVMSGAAKSTLDLAAAGGVSLPDAATIAANALAQFNLKGRDMAHVADLIAGAANASAIDVNDFKFSLAAAGAVANTVGFSFDDLAQGIAVMGRAGIRGSDAGTSLKTMMLNLQPSTKKATATMRELGLITAEGANRFFDAQGRVKSMAEIAGILQQATSKLTRAQRLQALETIFGTDAIRAAAVMAEEGAAGFNEMAGAMNKVTAASVGAERLNNLAGDIEQLKGSLDTAAITLGTAFLPLLRQGAQAATAWVNSMIPWIEQVGPQIVAWVERAAGVVETLTVAFGTGGLAGAFQVVLPLLQSLGQAFLDWAGRTIPGLLTSLGQMGETLLGWAVGLVPGIVQALVGWGTAFVDWVVPLIPPLLAKLVQVASAVWEWIRAQAPTVLATLGRWAESFVAWAAGVVAQVPAFMGTIAAAVWGWITATAPSVLARLGEWGTAFVGWIAPVVAAIPGFLGDVLSAVWTFIVDNAPSVLARLGTWTAAFFDWLIPVVGGIAEELWKFARKAGDWLINTGLPFVVTTLGAWADAFLDWIGPVLRQLPRRLAEFGGAVVAWIDTDLLPATRAAFDRYAPIVVKGLVTVFGDARDQVKAIWADLRSGVLSDFEPTFQRLDRLFDTIGRTLREVLGPEIERTIEFFGRIISRVGELLGQGEGQHIPFLRRLANYVNDWSASMERAFDLIGKVIDKLTELDRATRISIQLPTIGGGATAPAEPARPASQSGLPAGWSYTDPYGQTAGQAGYDPLKYAWAGQNWAPFRDQGGRGQPGQAYRVGVPELFVPDRPGQFMPLGDMAAAPITIPINIGGERITTVVARANRRYSERGGQIGGRW